MKAVHILGRLNTVADAISRDNLAMLFAHIPEARNRRRLISPDLSSQTGRPHGGQGCSGVACGDTEDRLNQSCAGTVMNAEAKTIRIIVRVGKGEGGTGVRKICIDK